MKMQARSMAVMLGVLVCGAVVAPLQAQNCPKQYTEACCEAVCKIDSFCCEVAWDETCDGHAKASDACGPPAPPNDTCDSAIEVSDGEVVSGTNIDATLNGANIPAACSGDPSFEYDVWYSIEVPETGLLTLSTCNTTDFDTRIFVFTSCDINDLVACNDDASGCALYSSQLTAALDPGTHYIMIDGYAGAQGVFDLSVSLQFGSPPANDDMANAIEVFEGSTPFTTAFATTDGTALPGGECSVSANFENDVWFTYTATADTRIVFSTSDFNTLFDSQMELLDSAGMSLACNDDGFGAGPAMSSTISHEVMNGETYTVRIGGFGNTFGDGVLHIASPPANDDCADAIALNPGEAAMFNSFAANDSPEEGIPDNSICNSYGLAEFFGDVWYTFEAPETAFYTLKTCELTDGLDTRIGVYDGCGGILLACNEDSCGLESSIYLGELDAGTAFTIRVGGFTNGNDRAYGLGGVVVELDTDDPCYFPRSIFDFDGDFTATTGTATIGPIGGDDSWFEFTTDLIDDTETGVVHVLGPHTNAQSLGVRYSLCPNPATAIWVNDFTMIWDIKVTANWIPLFNANYGDPSNYNDAEFFITPDGQFYVNGGGYIGEIGTIQPDTWYRIALVENLSTGNADIYVDGELRASAEGAVTFDGPHALYTDLTMVFADESGETGEAWLSSYLIDDYAMTSEQITEFGGPTPGGISVPGGGGDDCPPDLNGDGLIDGADLTILLGGWGTDAAGDIDGSGEIDGADLTMMLGSWGPC